MQASTLENHAGSANSKSSDDHHAGHSLREIIDHCCHLLPAQGPISVFIHHNTLHAFEHLPFEQAVVAASNQLGGEPFLSERAYANHLATGRIRDADLRAELDADLGASGDEIVLKESRRDFRLAMLRHVLTDLPKSELRWHMAEYFSLERYRADASSELKRNFVLETRHWLRRDLRGDVRNWVHSGTFDFARDSVLRFGNKRVETWTDQEIEEFGLRMLWRTCRDGVNLASLKDAESEHSALPQGEGYQLHPPHSEYWRKLTQEQAAIALRRDDYDGKGIRHRDLLFRRHQVDADLLVNQVLIPFTSAYLDQGLAQWQLPNRRDGFFKCFVANYQDRQLVPAWLRPLANELHRQVSGSFTSLDSIEESLRILGVNVAEQEAFLGSTLLALRGFAGMLWQVDQRADRVPHPLPPDSLIEFLAVRLILDRLAVRYSADELGLNETPLADLRPLLARELTQADLAEHAEQDEKLAFHIFELAQFLGWLPQDLTALDASAWQRLIHEFRNFSSLERRRVFHCAFERRFRTATLDAISLHQPTKPKLERPRMQVICCIDEREESFRRHLEEWADDCETFGAAGFFAVPMYYKGLHDAHFTPLCPVVIQPSHFVTEEVEVTQTRQHQAAVGARRVVGKLAHGVHQVSRTAGLGSFLIGVTGVFAGLPLILRVLFPRFIGLANQSASKLLSARESRLLLSSATNEPAREQLAQRRFTTNEMIDQAERLLRDLGMIKQFAPLVFILGHGSTSSNNPHSSAYQCGACGGSRGGPNARAAAMMLNDPAVRSALAQRSINIPSDTIFIGGQHDTGDDSVQLFDPHYVPQDRQEELARAVADFARVCEQNSHERCRRFASASFELTPHAALTHVQSRAQDLAEVRPECGHATNAVCFVGRRSRTIGLFMDRRSFLVSYDPTTDDADGTILARQLGAVVPVCGGINLEYYFSYVDSVHWGCGTKLPHNITALLGVMDGAGSDLRTGLPWQMVEIHEPVRLLFVIESTPEIVLGIMKRNPQVGQMIRNRWIQLAVLAPNSTEIQLFDGKEFHRYQPESDSLPIRTQSVEWYRGWRDHLGYASIKAATPTEFDPKPALARRFDLKDLNGHATSPTSSAGASETRVNRTSQGFANGGQS